MARPRILVFDSGVGGLSIAKAVKAAVPEATLVYCSDNEAFPYGTKEEGELIHRVATVLGRLVATYAPNLLVVACNTASTVALPRVRGELKLPVVGVVPAIKTAAARTQTGVIGLLATPGTVRRAYTDALIAEHASHCKVIRVGSPELVAMAEAKLAGHAVPLGPIRSVLAPFFEEGDEETPELDVIVLGCTHFPLLQSELEAAVPRKVEWIDSGDAIARRVLTLLGGQITQPSSADGRHVAVFTADTGAARALEAALAAHGFMDLHFLSVP